MLNISFNRSLQEQYTSFEKSQTGSTMWVWDEYKVIKPYSSVHWHTLEEPFQLFWAGALCRMDGIFNLQQNLAYTRNVIPTVQHGYGRRKLLGHI